jgi:5-methylcytosine-specific restriction endonuclease McrA
VTSKLRQLVFKRAQNACEYCQLAQRQTSLPHEVDHIRAVKHRGATHSDNLALACAYCNAAKGPNVAGHDPLTDELVPLFNPRAQKWSEHFRWRGPILDGKTAIGRATVETLRINAPERVEHRLLLAR